MSDARAAVSRRRVARLLKRVGLEATAAPDTTAWSVFLDATTALLADLEQDRYLLEQSLETSSQEMMTLYENLRGSATHLALEREELASANSLLAATLESTADGILVVDRNGGIRTFNGRFAEMWNIPNEILAARDDERAIGYVLGQLRDPDAFIAKVQALYATPAAASHDVLEFIDGRIFERESLPHCIDGEIVGRVWNFRDVTEQRRLQNELRHLAFHDPLTNLANRAVFSDHVDHAIRRQSRTGGCVAVAVVDLDGFKHVNDSLGHLAGDALLVAVADRFRSALRDFDTVARLGGDEFAMLVDGLASPEHAGHIARRILDTLADPIALADRDVVLGASVGIALAGARRHADPITMADELLGHADAAMYQAKRDGKGCYRIFESSMHDAAVERMDLEQSLRRAITGNRLTINYQPVVDARTGRVVSFEALARWTDHDKGVVPPDVFIPLAEETGLIIELGRSMLFEACKQTARWHAEYPSLQPAIAVNVSARQLVHPTFVDDVAAALADSGLPASSLTLEITESIVSSDAAIAVLDTLRRTDVRIAIDDFGTGYSSFAALAELPVDTLKVDKRFVDHLLSDKRRRGLVQAILQIAATLDLSTVAEGVETVDQHRVLTDLGCGHIQGYYFSRPMPETEATAFLDEHVAAAHAA